MLYDRSVSSVTENGKQLTLFGMAIPLLFENAFSILFGMLGTLVLSHFSELAVSATNMAGQVYILPVTALNVFSGGSVIIISIAMGEKNIHRAANTAGTGFFLTLIYSALITIVLCTFSGPFMMMMGLTGDLKSVASKYLMVIGAFFPLTAVLNYLNRLLICYGHSKVTMLSGVFSNVVYLVLCYTSLYIFQISPDGTTTIAVCSFISQLLRFLVTLYAFTKKKCYFRFCFQRKEIADILRIGIPTGLGQLSFNLSQTVTTSFIADWSLTLINTKIYTGKILQFSSWFSYAIGSAGAVLIGRHFGAGNYNDVKKLFRQNLRLAMMANFTISILVVFFRHQLMKMYTSDPEIIQGSLVLVLVDVVLELIRAINHISDQSLNAVGEVKTTLFTAGTSAWLCTVLMSYLFTAVLPMGLLGLWLASIIDEAFKASIYLCRWRSGKWQRKGFLSMQTRKGKVS